ncbi:hypothetical protein Pcinc_000982 [Petrolisthes cinctipes]|uniref:Uncharacterized protein n=1 Tax=Petrolisthes cinctipes TaxID=88211 RepID=A0AAE1GM84_PETCI|nr:hypothetical protein Pcinc_000982 [Petrolisthes cinctipes]
MDEVNEINIECNACGSGGVVAGEGSGGVVAGEGSGGVVAGEGSGGVVAGEGSGGVVAGEGSGGKVALTSFIIHLFLARQRSLANLSESLGDLGEPLASPTSPRHLRMKENSPLLRWTPGPISIGSWL